MLYDSHRNLAQPGERSTCPACGQVLVAKCGEIIIWHWAHLSADCDPWAEPESQWHLGWKRRLEAAGCQTEVVMGNHRADVVTPDGRIIELQAHYQDVETIRAREDFYGRQLRWLYRCHWHDRIHWGQHGLWWKRGSPAMTHHRNPLYWDMGDDVARVDINLVDRFNDYDGIWVKRILGRFIDRCSQEEAVRRWSGAITSQPTLEGDDIEPKQGIELRPIGSLVDALVYRFPGAELV